MNAVLPFDFNGSAVRVLEGADSPWFVASDVCGVLGTATRVEAAS